MLRRMAFALALLMVASSAALAVNPKLTIVQGPTTPPCNVTVRILVDPLGATADVSQFTIKYKSSCLTFTGATLGAQAPATSTIDTNDLPNSTGFPICDPTTSCASCATDFDRHVVVLVTPPNGGSYSGSGDKEILILNFTAASAGTSCKVEWDQSNPPGLKPTFIHLSTGDQFGTALTFLPNAAPPNCPGLTLTVPPLTLSGLIRYYFPLPFASNTNWIPNAKVCVAPPGPPTGCNSSNANGAYSVSSVLPGGVNVTPSRATDPADPSAIGGGDVNKVICALAGTCTLIPDQQSAADVDTLGTLNSPDLQKLRRYLVFDFAACPKCGTWKFICDPNGTPGSPPCAITMATCGNRTLDMKGILRGDVDGSWPGRFKASGPSPIALAFGAAEWNGLDFTVPVRAAIRDVALTSLIFSLEYNAAAFEYLGTDAGAEAPGFEFTQNPASPGLLHGLLTGGLLEMNRSGEVLRLRFRLRDAAQAGNITFARLLINDLEAARIPEIQVSRGGQAEALPKAFQMSAQPNPFNPSTQIDYTIPEGSGPVPVSLRVVDLSGRVVRDLVQAPQGPGHYRTSWNGRDGSGEVLASGVYMLQLRAGSHTATQKAVLLK